MLQVTETVIMGRIRQSLEVNGKPCWTLFDSGARNSYIVRHIFSDAETTSLEHPAPIQLGGGRYSIHEVCNVVTQIGGHPCFFQAAVLDEIGKDEDGRDIDIQFGALAMQQWSI